MTAKSKPDAEPAAAWERQPGETVKAYRAFRTYLELGQGRTLAEAARNLGHRNAKTVEAWSRKNGWQARLAAWEDRASKRADAALMDELEQRTRRHAELLTLGLEAMAIAPRELLRRMTDQELATEIRKLPLHEVLYRSEASTRAIARAVPVERLVRGLSTDRPASAGERKAAEQRVAEMTPQEVTDVLIGAGVVDLDRERQKRRAS